MSVRRIGLLGGTFDPIHMGHLDLATAAQRALGLTQVLVIPANVPPHRPRPLTSAFHRFAMVALAVAGRPGWRVSDVELRREAPSYTAVTLRGFHERGYPPTELFFLIGVDAFAQITTWRDYPRIMDQANFAVVSRPGHSASTLRDSIPALASRMVSATDDMTFPDTPSIFLIDAPTADVSSTAIRDRLATGESIEGMVDPRVRQHIEQHGLYGSPLHDRRRPSHGAHSPAGRLHGED